ncbi:MAG: T9SS type A sorting domain-containing protein [Paludibacter sp.]|nr:T9SS type A sorting domain-containing protein [Paludibacter sp.]
MKRVTSFLLVLALMLSGACLYSQNIIVVNSNADSGEGSFRQAIADALDGDSIVIPGNFTVTIESELTIDKNLSINGQGATIQVTESGVSAIRIFTLNNPALTEGALYNLTLKGGNVQGRHATASNVLNCGGIMLLDVTCTLHLENVSFLDSKGTYSGAFQQNNVNANVTLKSCVFSGNSAINNAGGLYNKGFMTITDCTFTNNSTTHNGSAIVTNKALDAYKCVFKENTASTTTNGAYGGVIFNTNNGTYANFTDCLFADNTAEARGAAVFGQSGNAETTIGFTNCTFYNNTSNVEASVSSNNAGSIFTTYAGITNLINCTMVGNTSKLNGIAFIRDLNTVKVNIVNSIVAYNYVGANTNDLTNSGTGIVDANTSILGTTTGTIGQTDAISFSYSPESNLFATFTTSGNRKPLLHEDGTVKLSGQNSVAYEAGKSSLTGFTIPTHDQLGYLRGTPPCVGAVEYDLSTGIKSFDTERVKLSIYPNPATDYINIITDFTIGKVELVDISGKTVLLSKNPSTVMSLNSIVSGMYLLRAYTTEGIITQKFYIK